MGWRYYNDWYGGFRKTKPRKAKGGIKAQSRRGTFGESWWAKRWIAVLESFDLGARLARGRSYARRGQVLSIDVQKGSVAAKVQGSRPDPYKVRIEVKTLDDGERTKLAQLLASEAIFAARLLAGEMPNDIEDALGRGGISLFPNRSADLKTACSCPDWSNPCKHVAAVYYLLGEEFDRDPFLIFRLRGVERDELLKELVDSGAAAAVSKTASPHQPETASAPPAKQRRHKAGGAAKAVEGAVASRSALEPLPADPDTFWGGTIAAAPLGNLDAPPVAAALTRRLGSLPFWRAETRFLDAMEAFYSQASERALDAVFGT
ncbi:MAG: SWIM zinc finger family protein [Planctomycetia bacterium]|nr:SWIM zinc finger family protein [Planctomycetia bacterium]